MRDDRSTEMPRDYQYDPQTAARVNESLKKDAARWLDSYVNHSTSRVRRRAQSAGVL